MSSESSVPVSIIVPVFNANKYIRDCLLSIKKQAFQDYEVIIVDDGSSDNSTQIIQDFLDDERFTLYKKENEGVIRTRRFGVKKAKGEFICFVDSDDEIHPNFISLLYEAITKTKADISVCGMFFWRYRVNEVSCQCNKEMTIVNNVDYTRAILSLRSKTKIGASGGYSCNKMYKRRIITDDCFVETEGAEDEIFQFILSQRIKKATFLPFPLYYYRRDIVSASTKVGWRRSHIQSRKLLVSLSGCQMRGLALAALAQQIASTIENIELGIEKDKTTIRTIGNEVNYLNSLIKNEDVNLRDLCTIPVDKLLRHGQLIGSFFGFFALSFFRLKKIIKNGL